MTSMELITRPTVDSVSDVEVITDGTFEGLLDAYDYESPQHRQIMEGVVLKVHEDAVIVDVGVKRDAFVPSKDLERLDDDVLERLRPGAEVMVYVLKPYSEQGNLIVSINKALERKDWLRADELLHSGEVVEAEVIDTNNGGLLVQFGRIRAFVPQSHLTSMPRGVSGEERDRVKESLVGQSLLLKVIDVDQRQDRLVLSERAAGREARRARLESLQEGQVLTGKVANLVRYGAFINLGGVDGLVHISELDHRHVRSPGDLLSEGDEVEVLVKSVDVERERIALSRKALLPSPWDTIEADYQVGDLVSGNVSNVTDFGAFVELPNGLIGLVHVSRMSTYGVSHPSEVVLKGDAVLVRITDIDTQRERIGLSMDAVTADEYEQWMAALNQPEGEERVTPDGPGGFEEDADSVPDPQLDPDLIPGEDGYVEAR